MLTLQSGSLAAWRLIAFATVWQLVSLLGSCSDPLIDPAPHGWCWQFHMDEVDNFRSLYQDLKKWNNREQTLLNIKEANRVSLSSQITDCLMTGCLRLARSVRTVFFGDMPCSITRNVGFGGLRCAFAEGLLLISLRGFRGIFEDLTTALCKLFSHQIGELKNGKTTVFQHYTSSTLLQFLSPRMCAAFASLSISQLRGFCLFFIFDVYRFRCKTGFHLWSSSGDKPDFASASVSETDRILLLLQYWMICFCVPLWLFLLVDQLWCQKMGRLNSGLDF